MSEKVLYQNTTQVSNFILDNLHLFNEGQLKIAMLITRKTIGWHKETDFIRGSQLIKLTGLSKPTVSKAVNDLIQLEVLVRADNEGNEIKDMPQGYRGELNYSLNKNLTAEQLVKNFNQLNILTRTGKKSLPYKTNSLQNSISSSKEEGNADLEDKKGMKSLADIFRSKHLVADDGNVHIEIGKIKPDNRIGQGWQFYAHEVVEAAGLKNGGRARIFSSFKRKNWGYAQAEKVKVVVKHANFLALKSEDDKVRYLIGALKNV